MIKILVGKERERERETERGIIMLLPNFLLETASGSHSFFWQKQLREYKSFTEEALAGQAIWNQDITLAQCPGPLLCGLREIFGLIQIMFMQELKAEGAWVGEFSAQNNWVPDGDTQGFSAPVEQFPSPRREACGPMKIQQPERFRYVGSLIKCSGIALGSTSDSYQIFIWFHKTIVASFKQHWKPQSSDRPESVV